MAYGKIYDYVKEGNPKDHDEGHIFTKPIPVKVIV